MSSDRTANNNRPLKPALASTRTARTPLAPRIAGNAASTPSPARPGVPRLPTNSRTTPVVSPRLKQQDDTPPTTPGGLHNITPRSYARISKGESAPGTPSQDGHPRDMKARSLVVPRDTTSSQSSTVSGVGHGLGTIQNAMHSSRSRSLASDHTSRSPPLIRSPGIPDLNDTGKESIESRFFHASDVQKHEPVPKKPEPKKTPSFFYANGKEDLSPAPPHKAPSPVLSAVSDKRTSNHWTRPEPISNTSKTPPVLSPSLASTTAAAPFFTTPATIQNQLRSPSPSRDNIHLSYRKGVSQVIGTRPSPSPVPPASASNLAQGDEPLPQSLAGLHRKSTSLSSLDSGVSQQNRRRSATAADNASSNSPLHHEMKSGVLPRIASPPADLPSIDTSLASPTNIGSPSQTALSPTKNASELAADARRERKVLDLEISNSSLLAINASLERELRRQKTELKRFRRLSRAGRFSMLSRDSSGLTAEGLGEEDHQLDEGDDLGEADLMADDQDDFSDSEDGSLLSGGEPVSPGSRNQDRLAKDERRLRVDLARHKELLVQSQSMNQSIKRCMYATEEMLREGKAALQYSVRVSDVKLGGRILSGDDDEIEVDDSVTDDGMETAKGLIDAWRGVRTNVAGSEGSGDRDSGIEVDKPLGHVSARLSNMTSTSNDSGRPPEDSSHRMSLDESRSALQGTASGLIPLHGTS